MNAKKSNDEDSKIKAKLKELQEHKPLVEEFIKSTKNDESNAVKHEKLKMMYDYITGEKPCTKLSILIHFEEAMLKKKEMNKIRATQEANTSENFKSSNEHASEVINLDSSDDDDIQVLSDDDIEIVSHTDPEPKIISSGIEDNKLAISIVPIKPHNEIKKHKYPVELEIQKSSRKTDLKNVSISRRISNEQIKEVETPATINKAAADLNEQAEKREESLGMSFKKQIPSDFQSNKRNNSKIKINLKPKVSSTSVVGNTYGNINEKPPNISNLTKSTRNTLESSKYLAEVSSTTPKVEEIVPIILDYDETTISESKSTAATTKASQKSTIKPNETKETKGVLEFNANDLEDISSEEEKPSSSRAQKSTVKPNETKETKGALEFNANDLEDISSEEEKPSSSRQVSPNLEKNLRTIIDHPVTTKDRQQEAGQMSPDTNSEILDNIDPLRNEIDNELETIQDSDVVIEADANFDNTNTEKNRPGTTSRRPSAKNSEEMVSSSSEECLSLVKISKDNRKGSLEVSSSCNQEVPQVYEKSLQTSPISEDSLRSMLSPNVLEFSKDDLQGAQPIKEGDIFFAEKESGEDKITPAINKDTHSSSQESCVLWLNDPETEEFITRLDLEIVSYSSEKSQNKEVLTKAAVKSSESKIPDRRLSQEKCATRLETPKLRSEVIKVSRVSNKRTNSTSSIEKSASKISNRRPSQAKSLDAIRTDFESIKKRVQILKQIVPIISKEGPTSPLQDRLINAGLLSDRRNSLKQTEPIPCRTTKVDNPKDENEIGQETQNPIEPTSCIQHLPTMRDIPEAERKKSNILPEKTDTTLKDKSIEKELLPEKIYNKQEEIASSVQISPTKWNSEITEKEENVPFVELSNPKTGIERLSSPLKDKPIEKEMCIGSMQTEHKPSLRCEMLEELSERLLNDFNFEPEKNISNTHNKSVIRNIASYKNDKSNLSPATNEQSIVKCDVNQSEFSISIPPSVADSVVKAEEQVEKPLFDRRPEKKKYENQVLNSEDWVKVLSSINIQKLFEQKQSVFQEFLNTSVNELDKISTAADPQNESRSSKLSQLDEWADKSLDELHEIRFQLEKEMGVDLGIILHPGQNEAPINISESQLLPMNIVQEMENSMHERDFIHGLPQQTLSASQVYYAPVNLFAQRTPNVLQQYLGLPELKSNDPRIQNRLALLYKKTSDSILQPQSFQPKNDVPSGDEGSRDRKIQNEIQPVRTKNLVFQTSHKNYSSSTSSKLCHARTYGEYKRMRQAALKADAAKKKAAIEIANKVHQLEAKKETGKILIAEKNERLKIPEVEAEDTLNKTVRKSRKVKFTIEKERRKTLEKARRKSVGEPSNKAHQLKLKTERDRFKTLRVGKERRNTIQVETEPIKAARKKSTAESVTRQTPKVGRERRRTIQTEIEATLQPEAAKKKAIVEASNGHLRLDMEGQKTVRIGKEKERHKTIDLEDEARRKNVFKTESKVQKLTPEKESQKTNEVEKDNSTIRDLEDIGVLIATRKRRKLILKSSSNSESEELIKTASLEKLHNNASNNEDIVKCQRKKKTSVLPSSSESEADTETSRKVSGTRRNIKKISKFQKMSCENNNYVSTVSDIPEDTRKPRSEVPSRLNELHNQAEKDNPTISDFEDIGVIIGTRRRRKPILKSSSDSESEELIKTGSLEKIHNNAGNNEDIVKGRRKKKTSMFSSSSESEKDTETLRKVAGTRKYIKKISKFHKMSCQNKNYVSTETDTLEDKRKPGSEVPSRLNELQKQNLQKVLNNNISEIDLLHPSKVKEFACTLAKSLLKKESFEMFQHILEDSFSKTIKTKKKSISATTGISCKLQISNREMAALQKDLNDSFIRDEVMKIRGPRRSSIRGEKRILDLFNEENNTDDSQKCESEKDESSEKNKSHLSDEDYETDSFEDHIKKTKEKIVEITKNPPIVLLKKLAPEDLSKTVDIAQTKTKVGEHLLKPLKAVPLKHRVARRQSRFGKKKSRKTKNTNPILEHNCKEVPETDDKELILEELIGDSRQNIMIVNEPVPSHPNSEDEKIISDASIDVKPETYLVCSYRDKSTPITNVEGIDTDSVKAEVSIKLKSETLSADLSPDQPMAESVDTISSIFGVSAGLRPENQESLTNTTHGDNVMTIIHNWKSKDDNAYNENESENNIDDVERLLRDLTSTPTKSANSSEALTITNQHSTTEDIDQLNPEKVELLREIEVRNQKDPNRDQSNKSKSSVERHSSEMQGETKVKQEDNPVASFTVEEHEKSTKVEIKKSAGAIIEILEDEPENDVPILSVPPFKENGDCRVLRVDNFEYLIKRNDECIFRCLIDKCNFVTISFEVLKDHVKTEHDVKWSGKCNICKDELSALSIELPIEEELNHMLSVHLKELRDLGNRNHVIDLLKPWLTKTKSHKSKIVCEDLLSEKLLTNLYKCMGDDCNFTSDSKAQMSKHLATHELMTIGNADNERSWLECCYCEHYADRALHILEHVDHVHSTSIFQCSRCFYRSCSLVNIKYHQEQHHRINDEENTTFTCSGKVKTISDYVNRINKLRSDNLKAVSCSVCTQKYIRKDLMIEHFKEVHKESGIPNDFSICLLSCIFCNFENDIGNEMCAHMVNNHPEELLLIGVRGVKEKNNLDDISSIVYIGVPETTEHIDVKPISSSAGQAETLQLLETNDPIQKFKNNLLNIEDLKEFCNPLATYNQSSSNLNLEANDETLTELKNKMVESLRYFITSEILHPCCICSEEINLENQWTDHFNTTHPTISRDAVWQCPLCPTKNSFWTYPVHFINHHNDERKTYFCYYCGKHFYNHPAANEHLKSHSGETAKCIPVEWPQESDAITGNKIGIVLPITNNSSIIDIIKHMIDISENKKEKDSQLKHMIDISKNEKEKESQLAYFIDVTIDLNENMSSMNCPIYVPEKERYICTPCNSIWIDEKAFENHFKMTHKTLATFKCPHCDTIINSSSYEAIRDHLKLHSEEIIYKCCLCHMYTYDSKLLMKHIKNHKQQCIPIVCFARDDNTANYHYEIMHFSPISVNGSSGIKIQCLFCSTIVDTYKNFDMHLCNVHKLSRIYQCYHCTYHGYEENVDAHIMDVHVNLYPKKLSFLSRTVFQKILNLKENSSYLSKVRRSESSNSTSSKVAIITHHRSGKRKRSDISDSNLATDQHNEKRSDIEFDRDDKNDKSKKTDDSSISSNVDTSINSDQNHTVATTTILEEILSNTTTNTILEAGSPNKTTTVPPSIMAQNVQQYPQPPKKMLRLVPLSKLLKPISTSQGNDPEPPVSEELKKRKRPLSIKKTVNYLTYTCFHCFTAFKSYNELCNHWDSSICPAKANTSYQFRVARNGDNWITRSALDRICKTSGRKSVCYQCSECSQIFLNKDFCINHMASKILMPLYFTYNQEVLLYGCDECNAFFWKEETAIEHIARHTFRFSCLFCKCAYRTRDELYLHCLHTHKLNDKRYKYDVRSIKNMFIYQQMLVVFPCGLVLTKNNLKQTVWGNNKAFIALIDKLIVDDACK